MNVRLANTDEELLRCFPAMQELRPHLDREQFVDRVRRQADRDGYILVFIEDGGDVVAVAGFLLRGREITMQTTAARTRLDLFVQASREGGVIPGTAQRVNPLQQFFVEVKTGPTARLTRNQRLAFPEIRVGGGIPRGLNAEKALLVLGEQSRAFQVVIIRR